jgi:1,4-dihydroxy-2-naphthoyl-CoA hydrolase
LHGYDLIFTRFTQIFRPSHMPTPEEFNQRGANNLPGLIGLNVLHISEEEVRAELRVQTSLMAPNGFLHAATLVALADTSAGYGCIVNLPPGAQGFTTLELKTNHLGTARDGMLDCVARPAHLGKTTQVWDATVTHRESGKTLVLFRCTQMVLYPKAAA